MVIENIENVFIWMKVFLMKMQKFHKSSSFPLLDLKDVLPALSSLSLKYLILLSRFKWNANLQFRKKAVISDWSGQVTWPEYWPLIGCDLITWPESLRFISSFSSTFVNYSQTLDPVRSSESRQKRDETRVDPPREYKEEHKLKQKEQGDVRETLLLDGDSLNKSLL